MRLVAAAFFGAILCLSARARAGNGETYYLGNAASMFAGAATATTDGAGALWYNPARLTEGGVDSVDLAVSAYLVRFGGTPDLESESSSITVNRYDGVAVQAVPTAASYKIRVAGWDLGYGLFVPNVTFSYPRSLARTGPGVTPQAIIAVDGSYELTEYYAGLGVGRRLAPGLSLGLALFGYYGDESAQSAVGLTKSDGSFWIDYESSHRQSFGWQLVSGLSYRAGRRLGFGFVLRTPVIALGSSTEDSLFTALGDQSSANGSVAFRDSSAFAPTPRGKTLAAARAALGVAIELSDRTTLSTDLKLRGSVSAGRTQIQKAVADLRVGIRARAASEFWLGGGLFTDRSATPIDGDATGTTLDFYGCSVGAEFGTPYRTIAEDGKRGGLRLSMGISLSYALGVGKLSNLGIAGDQGATLAESRQDHALAHEFVLTLNSSVSQLLQ
jgi:hypothetical protein